MRVCYIILTIIILALLLLLGYINLKYRSIINTLSHIGNNIQTHFNYIKYPHSLPEWTTNYHLDMARLAISCVMSAVNIRQNIHPHLPPYLKLIHIFPQAYGIMLKPTASAAFDYIIALRGTLSHQDILSDLAWTQIEYAGLGKVHRGFAKVAELMYPHINIEPNSKVLVTGHSLGASVAELLATRLAKEKNLQINLYLSARPGTGNLTWDNNVRKYVRRYLLINQSDDIPLLPLPTMIKSKISYSFIPIPIDQTVYFNYQTGNVGNNHNPNTYHYALYQDHPPFSYLWYRPITLQYLRH